MPVNIHFSTRVAVNDMEAGLVNLHDPARPLPSGVNTEHYKCQKVFFRLHVRLLYEDMALF